MLGRFLTDIEKAHRKKSRLYQRRAIRIGQLKSPLDRICVDCGQKASEYDHYLGYETGLELNVEPVCQKCHKRRSVLRHQHYPLGVPKKTIRFTGSSVSEVSEKLLAYLGEKPM
jgi:5-methylcytosine-specific restriction endonuclease McrA